jgi:hypothetical protein
MKGRKNYLNLTNGIEALPVLPPGEQWGFVRIQSTACEQKRWAFIIQDLDNDFLMNLALGVRCVVWDASQRKASPRALYQGLEWIDYALNRAWFRRLTVPTVRGCDCSDYFAACWLEIESGSPPARKLAYFRRFLATDVVRLEGRPFRTTRDGDDAYYRGIVSGTDARIAPSLN